MYTCFLWSLCPSLLFKRLMTKKTRSFWKRIMTNVMMKSVTWMLLMACVTLPTSFSLVVVRKAMATTKGTTSTCTTSNVRPPSLMSRRGAFRRIQSCGSCCGLSIFMLVGTTTPPRDAAFALGEGEPRMVLSKPPTAPLGALLPAAQQRLLLEKCLVLADNALALDEKKITEGAKNDDMDGDENNNSYFDQLKSIMVELDGDGNNARLGLFGGAGGGNSNNKDLSVISKYPVNKKLSGDLVRAAMNIYTSNLSFGERPEYSVTDSNWKKSFIRANDSLPDVKRVIAADLDLRDLYRNQVQLKLDDASAELYSGGSSSGSTSSSCDMQEFKNLLKEAADSFDLWLGMISDADVKEALTAALEGKSLQVYDSYFAGFIPPK